MRSVAWWIVAALGVVLAGPLAVHGFAYARAAARKRRARGDCPFENDDYATLPISRAVQLVLTETLLWCYAVLTAPHPPADRAPGPTPGGVPVIVLPPAGLPRASVRVLVRRLRQDGFSVRCPRLPSVTRPRLQRLRALDRALRVVWEQTDARTVDVIAPARTAALVAAHLAAGGSGRPAVRRLLTLGASGHDGPRVPPSTDVVAFYSYDDPFGGAVEAAPRPGALNVAIRALGRLGLLHAPFVYTLLREHLLAPPLARPSSWTSAAS